MTLQEARDILGKHITETGDVKPGHHWIEWSGATETACVDDDLTADMLIALGTYMKQEDEKKIFFSSSFGQLRIVRAESKKEAEVVGGSGHWEEASVLGESELIVEFG